MLIDENEYEYEFSNNEYNYDYLENTYNENKFNNYLGPNYIYNFRDFHDLSSKENGFLRGTMFNSLFDNYYKKIKRISTNNEREKMILKIQELTFESIDLTLYLDVYPNDIEVVKKLKSTNKELQEWTLKYESIYGPLESTSDKNGSTYDWSKSPWPFSKGGEF